MEELVYVTGAGGMIGSHLVEQLHVQGKQVIGSYFTPTVDLKEINAAISLLECDVRNSGHVLSIIDRYRPQTIYHLAAQSYPALSWDIPQITMDTNIGGTISVFEAIRTIRNKNTPPPYNPTVVVACSSAEYGAALKGTWADENCPLLPLHPYGVSKVGQDLLAYQYHYNFGIRAIRARIFGTTGERKKGDVVSDFVRRAVKIIKTPGSPCVLRVGNLDTRRAILDVRDTVEALTLLAEKGISGEAYNISADKAILIRDIVRVLEHVSGLEYEMEIDKRLLRPSDEPLIIGATEKIRKDTGWRQSIAIEETMDRMLKYWKGKPETPEGE